MRRCCCVCYSTSQSGWQLEEFPHAGTNASRATNTPCSMAGSARRLDIRPNADTNHHELGGDHRSTLQRYRVVADRGSGRTKVEGDAM